MKLKNFQSDTFLAKHWQQKPLFIEQAITDYTPPLGVDELAGLACDEPFTSRLIRHLQPDNWQLAYGPFSETELANLPEKDWSLLIQDLDKFFHGYAALLDYFDFIPRWRMDDVMVSLSPDGASVGPHTDNYDVFLFQAEGSKKWHINQHSFANTCLDNNPLRILNTFRPEQTFHACPGDVLYLPPGVAHHGIADGFSVTYSIGFRAPTDVDMMIAWMEHRASQGKARFYTDSSLTKNTGHGPLWLDRSAASHLAHHVYSAPNPDLQKENPEFLLWQGDYLTQPKAELLDYTEQQTCLAGEIELSDLLQKDITSIQRKPCCRVLLQNIDSQTVVHLNGEHYRF